MSNAKNTGRKNGTLTLTENTAKKLASASETEGRLNSSKTGDGLLDTANDIRRLVEAEKQEKALKAAIQEEKATAEESIYKPIENTPFIMIKRDGKYYMAWLGYILTSPTETEDDLMLKLETEKFEITAMYLLAILQEQKKEQEK